MQTAKPSTGVQTRAMRRQALADITPTPNPNALDTSPDSTSTSEPEPKEPPPSWDSLCTSQDCPIKHPHNFGLGPQPSSPPLIVWTDADALVTDDDVDLGYPDTEPPPLIKAMIDTLRIDPEIKDRYPRFTDVLRDFYEAHGGRSDKYHGPQGMFGLGVDRRGEGDGGFFPYHGHPDRMKMGGWFAFEIEKGGYEGDCGGNFVGE